MHLLLICSPSAGGGGFGYVGGLVNWFAMSVEAIL